MANAFNKEVKRSIMHSLGRFLAIAIIAALGCGFFAGLRMTSIDMDLSADVFYDETNLSDLYVTSTLGLDEGNLEQIAEIADVKAVAGVKLADVYALIGDTKYVVRFNSIDLEAARASDTSDGKRAISSDDSYINRPILVEGSWPEGPRECVIAADAILDYPVEIGDTVKVVESSSSDYDALAEREYVVTGFVRSPYYLMTSNFGSSNLGSGEIDTYVFVPDSDFAEDMPFSGAFVIVDGAMQELYPSPAYDERVEAVIKDLEGLRDDICATRLAHVKADAQAELDEKRAEYDDERSAAFSKLADAERKLSDAKAQLDDSEQLLSRNSLELDAAKSELEDGEVQLAASRKAAEERFAEEQAKIDLIPDAAMREHAQAALDEQKAAAIALFEEQETKLADARVTLEDGMRQLAAGQARYESGLAEYRNGVAEYEANRSTALRELADAEAKLDEAQAEIDDIEMPQLYILDRAKNVGVAGHKADASRIDQIAQVFPLIFFLVAALVVLTTMTRMVDEERLLIGTYKALGYGNGRIVSKYLIYAFITSGIGSIIGILLLTQFLPQFIMEAYSIIYALPVSISPLDIPIAFLAFSLSVGITLLVTWLAAYSSLRERPALLMLPRAPKPGKRILLERIGFVWKHLSFSSKVTARNLFRYKQRFLMAIIGIAGCTALLLTGLGLHDGINDIIDKQFGEIEHFNLEIQISSEQEPVDSQRVQEILGDSDFVADTMSIGREGVLATAEGSNEDIRTSVYVPDDLEVFEDFFTLRERIGHQPLTLESGGAVITEKLASELDVHVGDFIEVYEQSTVGERTGSPHQILVMGITEFYTGQRIFMTPEYYEAVIGQTPSVVELICKAEAPLEERTALANELLNVPGVEVVSYYDEIIETYRTMLKTVNAVVWVLIIAAALLAFVVIYNLTNINITERAREIATLKVLGFTPRETNAYIFRETLILTMIGALVGLALGVWMEGFVVVTAEVNEMMFGRDIHLTSFVIAFFMTIAFSIIVSLAMMPKIKSIDMVQSLKSVD